ncbi:MAG: hypothetical protein KDE27_13120 [Planctomycetes bacterium]|nr:hypothetical protein [Planctomycetota bacterium]
MHCKETVWLAFVLTMLLGRALVAQGDGWPRWTPDRLERATVKDENGKLQWAKWAPAEKCRTCTGTGKTVCKVCERFLEDAENCPDCHRKDKHETVCRTCLGTGSMPDPLEAVQCPGCRGGGYMPCTTCSGGGQLRSEGAKRWSDCPSCRGEGGFLCEACGGKRTVATAKLKPSLAEAESKDLEKALEATDTALAAISKFESHGKQTRKESKELGTLTKDAEKYFPPLKDANKQLKSYMGKIFAGSQYLGHEEDEAEAMNLYKAGVEYFLKHQKRMIELSLERAKANEKAAEADKDA